MREFITIVNGLEKKSLKETKEPLVPSILKEFMNDGAVNNIDEVVSQLEHYLGEKLHKFGPPSRVYDVDGGARGVIYVIGDGATAVGLSWPNRSAGIRSVYVWYKFSLLRPADFCFELPNIDFSLIAATMAKLIMNPVTGKVQVTEAYKENRAKLSEAVRTSEAQFVQYVRQWAAKNNRDITKISYQPDMIDVAAEYDVQVPGDVRNNRRWKTNRPGLYNFSAGGSGTTGEVDDVQKANDAIQNLVGADIAQAYAPGEGEEPDADFDNVLNLAKAKQLRRLIGAGKVYVTGRKNGRFFKFPVELFDQVLAMVERLLAQELADRGGEDGKTSMEEQYEELTEKVAHIASGRSTVIKSLLLTGSPSSGKSFTVMNVVKQKLGLKSGADFVYKKGGVTVPAMYRILIEQINGMAIFDDCDSVVKDADGLNILKGALETEKIRSVDYDKDGTVNTGVLQDDKVDEYGLRLSELLRQIRQPTLEDVEFFRPFVSLSYLKQTKGQNEEDDAIEMGQYPKEKKPKDETAPDELEDLDEPIVLSNRQAKIIEYVKKNLPNKINFKGVIIFISNMTEDEFASQGKGSGAAILSRSFYMNLSFGSGEMLNFIEKIYDKIDFAALTDEEKKETLDYIRARFSIGQVKEDINFRFVLTAFESRVMGKNGGNWKRQINNM
jgi:hypothetical protein